jgi:hypothetical protein
LCFKLNKDGYGAQTLEREFSDLVMKYNIIESIKNILDYLFWDKELNHDWNYIKN